MKKLEIPVFMKTSYKLDHQAEGAVTYEAVKKMEAFAKELLPPGFIERFEADARAFGLNPEVYMLGECAQLVCEVLRAFDLSESDEVRKSAATKKNGMIFRRNCQAEPFWLEENMTPARDKKIRVIREQNRKLVKVA